MDSTPRKHAGAKNELVACIWLLQQGYDVFRNISQHGDVDLIAMKDGKTIYIDVKFTGYTTNGKPSPYGNRLKESQIAMGVVRLNVYEDCKCEFVTDATTFMASMAKRHCIHCGESFTPHEEHQIFCNRKCTQQHHRIKRGKSKNAI